MKGTLIKPRSIEPFLPAQYRSRFDKASWFTQNTELIVPSDFSPSVARMYFEGRKRELAMRQKGFIKPRFLGVAPLINQPIWIEGDGQNPPWVMMRMEDDPVYQKYNGEYPIPEENLKEWKEIEKAGFVFPEVLVAHSLPKGSAALYPNLSDIPVSLLEPLPPASTVSLSQSLGRHSEKILLVLGAMAIGTLAAVAAIGLLTVPPAAAIISASMAVDPILIGVIPDKNRRYGLYFIITAYDWNIDTQAS